MVAELLAKGMVKFAIAPLMLASLALLAQESKARTEFVGTWEAKVKDQVVCTIRLARGEPLSGETEACSIHVDENGDLQAPESSAHSSEPEPILNVRLQGETLTFEEKDGDDVMKFELRLVGEGKAELTFPDASVRIKPIQFGRK
jgi:hypothetical protein